MSSNPDYVSVPVSSVKVGDTVSWYLQDCTVTALLPRDDGTTTITISYQTTRTASLLNMQEVQVKRMTTEQLMDRARAVISAHELRTRYAACTQLIRDYHDFFAWFYRYPGERRDPIARDELQARAEKLLGESDGQ